METWHRRSLISAASFLETFLRGMETCLPGLPRAAVGPLKPSLEGWKLRHRPTVRRPPSGLETFLRGMETCEPMAEQQLRLFLETFLRGMETPLRPIGILRADPP